MVGISSYSAAALSEASYTLLESLGGDFSDENIQQKGDGFINNKKGTD